jgi:hypothetical protein
MAVSPTCHAYIDGRSSLEGQARQTHYIIRHGITALGLARRLGVTRNEAARLLAPFGADRQ